MADDGITIERIRERAYDVWDRNHRPDGFDLEFWLIAERELKVEASGQIPARGNGCGGRIGLEAS
ncbi:DUF2934 domain-containing protein [Methylobacterium flocculans]|jgi:hypothetical protein|uniref:DUF2934 domain-containing protein n=1 Tax=Methylobacterium flocculans TaxID=2984843 RepID=UPI0021F2541F|nr:DUF2934 domain-containing protein [Methylobacterium sp. FF17]